MKITNKLKLMLKSILSLQLGEVKTDKAVLVFDGEDLTEGMDVFVMGEDNEPVPAEDGDYVTEDGKTIKVVEGKVAEIVDPEAEVATEEELASEVDEEVEMEDNTEVEIVDEPEEEKTVDTDERIAALEARLAEFTDGLNQIVNAIAALEERIGEVEGKLAKVEAPAADPIDEQPEVEEQEQKRSRLSYLRKD